MGGAESIANSSRARELAFSSHSLDAATIVPLIECVDPSSSFSMISSVRHRPLCIAIPSDPKPTMTNGDFSASSFALCAGYISIVCIDRILSTHDIVKVTSC